MSLEQVQATVNELATAWKSFKDTNEKRIADLEKNKGTAEYEAQLEKINTSIDKFENALKNSDEAAKKREEAAEKKMEESKVYTAELERKVNMLQAGAIGAGSDDAKATNDAAARMFQAQRGRLPEKEGEGDPKVYEDYKRDFRNYLRTGQMPQASMSVGSDKEGGYLVPTERSDQIIKKLFETSPIRSIASVITIGTDAIEFPIDAVDATSGGWVAETGSRSDTDTPTWGMQRIQVHEQYASPKVTQKLLDDGALDVEAWLTNKVADKLARTENTAFVTGDGSAKPRGFLDHGSAAVTTKDATRAWGVLQYVPSGASGAFATLSGLVADDANPLINIVYALHPNFRTNANWVMNRATVGNVRKLRDANGQYYWQPGLQAGQPSSLLNYPIMEAEDMPDIAANSYSIAFGDFKAGYMIVDRIGIRTLRDPYTSKPFIVFYTTSRVGGAMINSQAIKLLKMASS